MRYTTFGRRTGLRASEYTPETVNFGTWWHAGTERDEAKAIFDRFVETGGNFIDTTDTHQAGQSEQLLGEFIHADRDKLVRATKFTVGANPDRKLSRIGNARKNLRIPVEDEPDPAGHRLCAVALPRHQHEGAQQPAGRAGRSTRYPGDVRRS